MVDASGKSATSATRRCVTAFAPTSLTTLITASSSASRRAAPRGRGHRRRTRAEFITGTFVPNNGEQGYLPFASRRFLGGRPAPEPAADGAGAGQPTTSRPLERLSAPPHMNAQDTLTRTAVADTARATPHMAANPLSRAYFARFAPGWQRAQSW